MLPHLALHQIFDSGVSKVRIFSLTQRNPHSKFQMRSLIFKAQMLRLDPTTRTVAMFSFSYHCLQETVSMDFALPTSASQRLWSSFS